MECLHRTAAEWLQMPHVQAQLQEHTPQGFDAYMSLFLAQLTLTRQQRGMRGDMYHRDDFDRALAYAAFANDGNTAIIVDHWVRCVFQAQSGFQFGWRKRVKHAAPLAWPAS